MTSLGLLKKLDDFDNTAAGRSYDLRLDLAEIILRHLDGKQWTQKRLAQVADIKEPQLTRVIHSAANCTFDTAGRLLFALDVRAKLVEVTDGSPTVRFYQTSANTVAMTGSVSTPPLWAISI